MAKKHDHFGQMLTVVEIAHKKNIKRQEAAKYIQYGNPVDGRGAGRRLMFRGQDWSAKKIAEMTGLTAGAIRKRVRKGIGLEDLEGSASSPSRCKKPSHWGWV